MIRLRLAELRLAALLLTRVPAGPPLAEPVPPLSAASWAYPVVGACLGALAWAVVAGAMALGLPPWPAALLALAAVMLATGGLHEDGLADYADAAGAGGPPERRLQIMRDSRIGAHGALALVTVTGLRWSALATLAARADAPLFWAIVGALALSRAAMAILQQITPPARADGLGQSASRPGLPRAVVAALLALVPIVPLGVTPALTAAALAALVTGLLAWHARATVGGQTGDVLGATGQLVEAAVLLGLAAALSAPLHHLD